MKNYKYIVQNLDCANCAKKIEDKIASYDEYKNVKLNFATLKLSLDTEKEKGVKEEIQKIITSIEPDIEIIEENEKQKNGSIKGDIIRLILRNYFIYDINAI